MKVPTLTYYNMPPHVTAFSTTRLGGYSHGAYGEFNINRYCGDDEKSIEKNTEALCTLLKISQDRIIMPHQTHGNEVRLIAPDFLALPAATRSMLLEDVDALITDVRGICIGVSTADCIPVILYDPEHHTAAAVHAGWRGTVSSIAVKAVDSMRLSYGSRPEALTAVIGPGISLDAFEVGDEVYNEFASAGFDMQAISRRKDKWHIDLKECNRIQLTSVGLSNDNITISPICTYANTGKYFSARKLGPMSGRIFTGVIIE